MATTTQCKYKEYLCSGIVKSNIKIFKLRFLFLLRFSSVSSSDFESELVRNHVWNLFKKLENWVASGGACSEQFWLLDPVEMFKEILLSDESSHTFPPQGDLCVNRLHAGLAWWEVHCGIYRHFNDK